MCCFIFVEDNVSIGNKYVLFLDFGTGPQIMFSKPTTQAILAVAIVTFELDERLTLSGTFGL